MAFPRETSAANLQNQPWSDGDSSANEAAAVVVTQPRSAQAREPPPACAASPESTEPGRPRARRGENPNKATHDQPMRLDREIKKAKMLDGLQLFHDILISTMSLQEDRSHLDRVRAQLESAVTELSALIGPAGESEESSASRNTEVSIKDLTLYSAFRDYVKHEDDLTGGRLNWNLAIQGFLFLSWTYCLQKVVDLKIALAPREPIPTQSQVALMNAIDNVEKAMRFIGWTGIAINLVILFGALGAQFAIRAIDVKWREGNNASVCGGHLPRIIGGGRMKAHILGAAAVFVVPFVFIAAWVMLLSTR